MEGFSLLRTRLTATGRSPIGESPQVNPALGRWFEYFHGENLE
ncbi:hypothetical protein [Synechocystis salina]|nr:hypothetical protein [Synechocystis salina]